MAISLIYYLPIPRSMVGISRSSCPAGLVPCDSTPANILAPSQHLIPSKQIPPSSTAINCLDEFVSSHVRRPRVPFMSLVESSADQIPLFDPSPFLLSPIFLDPFLLLEPIIKSRSSGSRRDLRSVFACSFGPLQTVLVALPDG